MTKRTPTPDPAIDHAYTEVLEGIGALSPGQALTVLAFASASIIELIRESAGKDEARATAQTLHTAIDDALAVFAAPGTAKETH